MRASRLLSRSLAVLGLIALSATSAYAGGGAGAGSTVLSAFQCYLINGDQPPATNSVVNLVDQFGSRENVRIGQGRLLCTPVEATKPDGTEPVEFDPLPDNSDHIKCYTISPFERGPRGRLSLYNPNATVDLSDELDIDRGVKVGVPAFLCTLARKDCVDGCPVAPPAAE